MLDFHAHVLPGADHGSDGLQTSLRQLALAEQAGIDVLVATPHFYPQRDDFDHFLKKREAARAELADNYGGSIRLLLGAEVHVCVGLDHLEGLEELKAKIAETLQESHSPVTFTVPFSRYGILSEIRPLGRVISETHTDTGTELTLMIAAEDAGRIVRKYGAEIIKKETE